MSINKLLNFYIKHKLFLHFLKDSSLKRNLRGKRLHFHVKFFKYLSKLTAKIATVVEFCNGIPPTSLGKNILSITSGNNVWKYEANPNTEANITFHYNSKLSACRAKADSIKVNSFFQTLEDESFNQLC